MTVERIYDDSRMEIDFMEAGNALMQVLIFVAGTRQMFP